MATTTPILTSLGLTSRAADAVTAVLSTHGQARVYKKKGDKLGKKTRFKTWLLTVGSAPVIFTRKMSSGSKLTLFGIAA